MQNHIELLPILLEGKPFSIDPTGTFAINTDGRAIRLADRDPDSRFR